MRSAEVSVSCQISAQHLLALKLLFDSRCTSAVRLHGVSTGWQLLPVCTAADKTL
jgi:hypothetical protein